MRTLKKLTISVVLILSCTVSLADSTARVNGEIKKVINLAAETGYKAGWCRAMANLGVAIDEDKSGALREKLAPFVVSEMEANGMDARNIRAECAKAIALNLSLSKEVDRLLSN